jgi:hypothetical protein
MTPWQRPCLDGRLSRRCVTAQVRAWIASRRGTILLVRLPRAWLLPVLLVALWLGPDAVIATDHPSPVPSETVTTFPERILFIGNSHTERYGGMDWLVGNLVASVDPPQGYEAERMTASGVTLEYHFQNGAPERIREGDWDVVVLQESLPASPTRTAEPFLEYARRFDEIIRRSGARPVFYMTWPQRNYDWADLDDFVAAHRQVEAELGVKTAPVGVAMARAQSQRPDLSLLDADGVHASWEGAYLAAAVIYATLFDRSPQGLDYTFPIRQGDADFLQRVAWETVTDWQAGKPPSS